MRRLWTPNLCGCATCSATIFSGAPSPPANMERYTTNATSYFYLASRPTRVVCLSLEIRETLPRAKHADFSPFCMARVAIKHFATLLACVHVLRSMIGCPTVVCAKLFVLAWFRGKYLATMKALILSHLPQPHRQGQYRLPEYIPSF